MGKDINEDKLKRMGGSVTYYCYGTGLSVRGGALLATSEDASSVGVYLRCGVAHFRVSDSYGNDVVGVGVELRCVIGTPFDFTKGGSLTRNGVQLLIRLFP